MTQVDEGHRHTLPENRMTLPFYPIGRGQVGLPKFKQTDPAAFRAVACPETEYGVSG